MRTRLTALFYSLSLVLAAPAFGDHPIDGQPLDNPLMDDDQSFFVMDDDQSFFDDSAVPESDTPSQ